MPHTAQSKGKNLLTGASSGIQQRRSEGLKNAFVQDVTRAVEKGSSWMLFVSVEALLHYARVE